MITWRRLVQAALGVLVLVGGWSFAHKHREPVTLDYWFGSIEGLSLWMVLVGAFAAGVLVAALIATIEIARLSLLGRRYRREIAGLEEEVHQLRNLPLASGSPDAEGAFPSADDAVS